MHTLTCRPVLLWWHTRLCSSSQHWADPHFCYAGNKAKWNRRAGTGGPVPDMRAPHLPATGWTRGERYGCVTADTALVSIITMIMGFLSPRGETPIYYAWKAVWAPDMLSSTCTSHIQTHLCAQVPEIHLFMTFILNKTGITKWISDMHYIYKQESSLPPEI